MYSSVLYEDSSRRSDFNPELSKLLHLPMKCQSDLYRVQSLYNLKTQIVNW